MQSSTAEVITASCGHKRAYSARCARLVAQRLREHGKRVSPYRCFNCGHWHIGAAPSMDQLQRIAQAIRDLHGNLPSS